MKKLKQLLEQKEALYSAIITDLCKRPKKKIRKELEKDLIADLKAIFAAYGQIMFSPDVVEAFRAWHLGGRQPVPDHPKLEHYLPRRHIHLLKIAMVISIARSPRMVIEMKHYQEALDTLLEAEAYMPDVFKSMSIGGGDSDIYNEAYKFMWALFAKEGKPIMEHRLIRFLMERAPSYSVDKLVETMITSELLKIVGIGEKGRRLLQPLTR